MEKSRTEAGQLPALRKVPVSGRPSFAMASFAAALTLGCLGVAGSAAGADLPTNKPRPAESTGIEPGANRFEELDPRNFDRSENIDHAWWPLKPGVQWVFEGSAEEDGQKVPHRIVFTVTDLVKVIGGVRSRVILDSDFSRGKMVEKELTFFAQDKQGTVWHLGQYRESYEGDLIGGQIWHVGNPEGAKAGIMMPANPQLGTPSYSEGYAPAPFNWTDRGRVYQVGQKIKVPAGSYSDVLVIEEFDASHPGAFQLKYYARGVGNIRVGSRGRKAGSREDLELVRVGMLSPQDLAEVRATALDLEKRASMYPAQPPLEHVAIAE